jgi:hypothetical protein
MSRLSTFLRSFAGSWPLAQPAIPGCSRSIDSRWQGQLLPLVSADFPIAVCWSPKAGCTTVLKWFLSQRGLLEGAIAHSPWVHDYREQRLCAGRDYLLACDRLFTQTHADKYIVKVIRDPARRAVSGYLHLLRCEHHKHWTAGMTLRRWKEDTGLGQQSGLSFRQFLRFLTDSDREGSRINPHFRRQYEPLQDPHVHAYIPLERLAACLGELERLFRLPHVDVRSLSDSVHHNPPSSHSGWPGIPATLPADRETLERLGTPTAESLLDPETTELVHSLFRIDYEAYGSFYGPTKAVLSIHAANVATAEDHSGGIRPSLRRAA